MTSVYVNVYIGQTRAAGWIRTLESYGFGEMVCRGELPARRHPWAFDNGAFKDWTAGKEFDSKKYERDLEIVWRQNTRPDFIVAPDIVAGGLQSLAFSLKWVPALKPIKAPVYLVVQDGMTPENIGASLDFFDGLFVGGTLPWKLKTGRDWVRFAHDNLMKCHIGRFGTEQRVRAAIRWGADSIDSCLPLWSADNLRRFLRGFEPKANLDLPLEVA